MRVAITGASGLIGSALLEHLQANGHSTVALRRPTDWDPSTGRVNTDVLVGCDAVVHLAGVGIAEGRWTDEQKRAILESRTRGTALISDTIATMDNGPRTLICGSAIGWYGERGDDELTEAEPAGTGFLADVVEEWEEAAQPAIDSGLRVTFARTAQVLSTKGGSLAKQLPFFKLGLGGKAGSGRQWVSWISIEDEVRALEWLLHHDISGPVNLSAPEPVRNAEFAKTLGKVLKRPTTFIPMIGPRLLYGQELADSLLLTSQRVVPAVLEAHGFEFNNRTLEAALRSILR